MNKNIKKIIAIALMVSAFGATMPATNLNLITTRAYASTGDLESIKLKTSSGNTIKTYSDNDYKSKNEIDDDEMETGETYFARTPSKKIKISASGVSSSHVRIFKGKSNSTRGVKLSSTIDLSSESTTTLVIRTYDEDPGTVKYSDDSYVSEYTIKVKCTASSSDNDENGDVYLKSLSLSEGSLSFSKKTNSYNVNVAESVDDVTITAKPDCDSDEYDDYEVTIDDTTVDEDDKFKKSVSLNKGKNVIKVTVENDDDEMRTYTLNITRGQTNTNTNAGGTTSSSTPKINQWVIVDGRWQYNDVLGNPIKNTWFYDRNYGKNYYLQYDGSMATGWLYYSANWYYLGYDGGMKTGWQLVGGNWYYLDSDGRMQTGWIRDIDGRYYYLYSNGSMAYNTTINGYVLGANGAWIR